MVKKRILVPIPSNGCDPSEVGIPCKLMMEAGIEIVFATPNGYKASTDSIMLTGKKLGIWKPILAARKDAVEAYLEVEKTQAFSNPISYDDIKKSKFDAVYLPGGHDKPVKEYLESEKLQSSIACFFEENKPVGAVCHGVVLVARSKDAKNGKSVIYDYKTTSLLNAQELLGYNITRLWMKDYYLTYPEITVEDEVTSVLAHKDNFIKGPMAFFRDSPTKMSRGFFVKDRNYISARWPGDLYNFTAEFIKMVLKEDSI
ncbi:MAG: type 1 glutamine amidotransferase domain-containing protein [Cyclobacteriaceae bacterium]|nr:type 1 glutamine amidotransferase domain-containing protein [Cyclobacteriaceae bacterium]